MNWLLFSNGFFLFQNTRHPLRMLKPQMYNISHFSTCFHYLQVVCWACGRSTGVSWRTRRLCGSAENRYLPHTGFLARLNQHFLLIYFLGKETWVFVICNYSGNIDRLVLTRYSSMIQRCADFSNKNLQLVAQYCCVARCWQNVPRVTTPIFVARLCVQNKSSFYFLWHRKIFVR